MTAQKKKTYHHGNLRSALIENGQQILETEGIDALSLRYVARKTGVTQAAPYSHFKDKNALLAAIAEKGFQNLALQMADEATGIKNSLFRIEALALSYLDFATKNLALFHLMFGRELAQISNFPTLAMTAGKSYSLFSSAISTHLKTKEDSRDPQPLTVSVWGMVHGLTSLIVDGKIATNHIGAPDNKDFIQKVFENIQL